MTGDLFQLAWQGIKRRRKSSLLLFAVLCLSFAFAIVTLSVSGSMKKTNEEYRLDTFGAWQGAVPGGLAQDEKFLREQEWLSELGVIKGVGDLSSDGVMKAFGTADETLLSMGRLGLQDGRWPEAKDEIVVEAAALSALGFDYTLGQEITVQAVLPTRPAQGELTGHGVAVEHTFTLCGVLREYSTLWKSSFSGWWQGELPSALMTEETASLLRQEAEVMADQMEQEAQEAIDEAKAAGEEPDPSLFELLDLTLEDITPSYFFTAQEGMESEMKSAVNEYLAAFSEGEPRGKIQENTLAYGDNGEAEINTFYAGLLFGVTVLAVLCIYAIQLQKQVRQYALFRSIGIKKSQLRKLVFFETLLLCVPAVILGAALGAAGTWAVLKLAVYSGSAPIQVDIPWALLGILAAVWLLGVALARLVILQLALHAPLTGRIAMESKKARRVRRARKALIAALSALLCGAVVFTALEAFRPLLDMRLGAALCDYMAFSKHMLNVEGKGEDELPIVDIDQNVISDSFVNVIEQVPGVSQVRANAYMYAELLFDGMEQVEFYQELRERQRETYKKYRAPDYSPNALAVQIVAYREGELGNCLDFQKLGIDPEAFRRGEQVIVSLCSSYDETFHPDGGVETGDTIDLNIYGYRPCTRGLAGGQKDVDFRALWSFSPKAVVFHSVPKDSEPYFTNYDLISYREKNAAIKQNSLQTLILLFSGGGCVIVVLLLLLSNAQTMETEREKKKYGILQALGMSRKQLKGRLTRSALFRGLLGVFAGWAVMGGYVVYSAYQTYLDLLPGPEELRLTMAEALGQEIHSYMTAGMTAWAALLLTALAVALTAVIALLSQRSLLHGGPMEKLREEE